MPENDPPNDPRHRRPAPLPPFDDDDNLSDFAPEEIARARATGEKPRRKSLSTVLTEIAADDTLNRVSVADLLRMMHGRAIGALMLIFAFPNVLPSPPGTSGVLGLPLVYLTSQMMLGRLPWLPGFIANRSMTREDFAALVARAGPLLARAERLLRPRLAVLVTPGAERVIGAVCLLLAVIVLLPIPLGNMLPALAICIFALGVLERDGVWIIAGLAVAVGAVAVVAGVVLALAKAAVFLFLGAFG